MRLSKLIEPRPTCPRRFTIVTSLALLLAVVLVTSACGGGSDTPVATASPGASPTETAPPNTVLATGSASDFCDAMIAMADEFDSIDDEELEAVDFYDLLEEVFGRIASAAPNELKGDVDTVMAGIGHLQEWSDDPSQPIPLDDAAMEEFEAANTRIEFYIGEECGLDMYEAGSELSDEPGIEDIDSGSNSAVQVVSLGGDIYEETLSGDFEVSCDMYGSLDDGSINIYLEGFEFQSSISSYDSGAEPGIYEGRIWVFASDPVLDELAWDLQEIDGIFILDGAEEASDDMWEFSGSFIGESEDAYSFIEATFSCVGFIGY